MISEIIKNSAINTKILSMKHSSLSEKEYETMSRLSSVSEVAAFLKTNTRYSYVLKDIDTSSIHRGVLESLLKGQIKYDIKSILSFSPKSAKFFLKILSTKEEIDNIKIFLRYLLTENTDSYKRETIFTSPKIFTKLKNTNNFKEFTEALADTEYYIALKPFIDFPERQNLFELEMALDRFFSYLCTKYIKKHLSKADAKSLIQSFGIQSDLDTIMFIMRSKNYYNFSPEQIYSYINLNFFRLKNQNIKNMVMANNQKEIINILKITPYKNIFSESLSFFEKNVHKYKLKVNYSLYKKNPHSTEAIQFYIYFKEIEIKNITTIIEGIRYGLAPEEIIKHLILIKNTD